MQGEEKGKEGECAEGAARNQEDVIVAFPIELSARYLDATDQPRDEATEEDDLHRWNAIELFTNTFMTANANVARSMLATPRLSRRDLAREAVSAG